MAVEILESTELRLQLDTDSGCFDVLEKLTGEAWDRDPLESAAGELVLVDKANGERMTASFATAAVVLVSRPQNHKLAITFEGVGGVASVSTRLTLLGAELAVELLDATYDESRWDLESVHYPARQFSLRTTDDVGYLALPYGQGCLVPSERFRKPPRNNFHQYDDLSWQGGGLAWGSGGGYAVVPVPGWNGLSMPWFGATKGSSAFVTILETPNDVALDCILNYNMQHLFDRAGEASTLPRIASASTRWLAEMGSLGYARKATFTFLPRGNYVTMAKAYRTYAQAEGLLTHLRDKLAANPQVEKLFGASLVNIDGGYPWYTDYDSFRFKWEDIRRIAVDMHDVLGLEHAVICTWGGYSKLPPQSLPFDERAGSHEDLADMVRTVQDDLGYVYTTYHGYPSLLAHSSSWDTAEATKSKDGSISGRWGGRSPSVYLRYAQENLPTTLAITGQQADYSDIVTNSLNEDYSPEHPLTRTDSRRVKTELFEYIRSLGVLTGSELCTWWATPVLDYCKGGMYVGRLHFLLRYIHAPLFNLVFHDAMVIFDGTVGISRDYEYSEEVLECLAYGVNPIFSCSLPYYEGLRGVLQEQSAALSDVLRRVALDELEDHEYLDEGYNVQRTRFSSGTEVLINTDSSPYQLASGESLAPRGFLIRNADGTIARGQLTKSMTTTEQSIR